MSQRTENNGAPLSPRWSQRVDRKYQTIFLCLPCVIARIIKTVLFFAHDQKIPPPTSDHHHLFMITIILHYKYAYFLPAILSTRWADRCWALAQVLRLEQIPSRTWQLNSSHSRPAKNAAWISPLCAANRNVHLSAITFQRSTQHVSEFIWPSLSVFGHDISADKLIQTSGSGLSSLTEFYCRRLDLKAFAKGVRCATLPWNGI